MSAGKRSLSERLRWRIAFLLDRSTRFCWADLVYWAIDGRRSNAMQDGPRYFLESLSSRSCQIEGAEPEGCCYCGKFRDRAYSDATETGVEDE